MPALHSSFVSVAHEDSLFVCSMDGEINHMNKQVVNEINSSPFRNHQFYPVESILDQMGMAIGR